MNILKKGLTAAVSAALIASLTIASTFATVGATGDSDQTDHLACLNAAVATVVTCSQVADGISTVTLSGDATGDAAGKSLYISATGATIISAAGDFVLGGGIVTDADPIDLTAADTIVLRAPSAAGTATVSVYEITTATGIAALEGTLTITFTATSGLAVSEANSTVKIIAYDATPTAAECTAAAAVASGSATLVNNATLCVTVHDGNNSAVNAPMVAVTITPVGLVNGAQSASGAADATGFEAFQIQGSTLAGVATIGISVTVGSTTTTFVPKTFTFTGALASITATNNVYALAMTAGATADVVRFTAKDAAGNFVPTSGATAVSSNTLILTVGSPVATDFNGTSTGSGKVTVDCVGTAGSATVTISQGSISSNAVTVYCSDVVSTVTVAFADETINPGGSTTITVTAKDAGGRPVADGTGAALLVSSGAATAVTNTTNGLATATYLAPFNTGVVTALATVGTVTGSGSATVGAVVPPGTTFNTTGSALGNTLTGPFTSSTKISTGGYITWRFDGGAAMAGKTIQIWAYKKVSLATNPWSAPYLLTTRVANASGVAFANITSGSVIWLSLRPVLPATATDAAVWGSWSIGRWIH